MSDWKNMLANFKTKIALLVGIGSQISVANLVLMSPVLMGSLSELSRAGDAMSLPIHYCITALVFTIIWASLAFSASIGVVTMIVYLVFLGWIRRSLIPSTGYISNDPITLVSAFIGILYFLRMVLTKKLPRYTYLSKIIYIVVILMFIEVFNPFQKSIAVGIGGIIFRLTPLFWYYIGFDKSNRSILRTIFVLVVALGLIEFSEGYRQISKLSEVERFWTLINIGATQAINKDIYRSFGTFLSFSEYVLFLGMSSSLCWVAFLQKKYIYIIPFI